MSLRTQELLFAAILNEDVEAVRSLLSQISDIDEIDRNGNTLLLFAIERKNKPIVEMLLAAGANVTKKNQGGNSPLIMAAYVGSAEMTEIILKALITRVTPYNFYREVNFRNNSGYTALIYAVHKQSLETVKLLVEAKADVNLEDHTSNTPLMYAVDSSNRDILLYLLQHEADPDAQDLDGNTVLHRVAGYGDSKMIGALLDAGADINMKNNEDYTPILISIDKGQYEAFTLLFSKGAKLFRQSLPEGISSLLQLIVASKSVEILNQYLKLVPDVSKEFRGLRFDEETPYEMIRILLIYGLPLTAELGYHFPQLEMPRFPSGRPKVNLHFVEPHDCSVGKYHLPVMRYPSIYYGPVKDTAYCGTFYFYEPSSDYHLELGNFIVVANKYHAYRTLSGMTQRKIYVNSFTLDILKHYLRIFFSSDVLPALNGNGHIDRLKHFLHDELLSEVKKKELRSRYDYYHQLLDIVEHLYVDELDKHDAAKNILKDGGIYRDLGRLLEYISTYPQDLGFDFAEVDILLEKQFVKDQRVYRGYIGDKLTGQFDAFDQEICILAQQARYDTIILQREVGKDRIITEILDTRPRHISYKSICKSPVHPLEGKSLELPPNKQLIWYPQFGLVSFQ